MKMNFLQSFKAIICLVFLSLCVSEVKAQYCTPAFFQGCTFGSQINTFKITGVSSTSINDLSTGCASTYYQDNHLTMSVTLDPGGSYTLQANSSIVSLGTDYIQVWIDFNDDNSFSSGESVGGGGPMSGTLANYPISIPLGAAPGTHRMRAEVSGQEVYPSLDPCPTFLANIWGEVHDYSVVITGSATTCPPVTGLSMSAITSASATLSWAAATGAIGYEWAVTTSATPPASGTATTLLTANATALTASTAYYAHVRTKCSATTFSAWTSTPFTTSSSSSTCVSPTLSLGAGTSTTQVVNWTAVTGATGYEWVVDMVATAPTGAGTATTLTTFTATSLTPSTAYYAHVRTNCGTSFSSWSTIPFTTGASTTVCNPVTGLTASSITTSSALVSWTAVAGSVGYQYVINTTATAPTGSGANIITTNTSATGLTAATTYYAHVRDSCGPGSFSAWVTIPFTTLSTGCAPITGLTASAITASSATVSWTAITGTAGYQYVIDNTVATPAGSGTNTTTNSTSATSLTAGTTYYAHVRDSCGPGNFSAWTTIPFTTLSTTCNAVTSLTASAITSSSATITWVRPTGTLAAQYVLNTNPADPTTSGTVFIVNTTNATGLFSATTYYAHVRDTCGPTALSAWVTIPITTLASGVGVIDVNAEGNFAINAYPNPVSGALTVDIQGGLDNAGQIELMDMTGKLIKVIAVQSNSAGVDMSGLSSGLYLIRYSDAAHTQTIKISKQ